MITATAPACADPDTPEFTDSNPLEKTEAAAICSSCPLRDACLSEARRIDTAYRAGTDSYGIWGVWGGWWFQPGKTPRPVLGDLARQQPPIAAAA